MEEKILQLLRSNNLEDVKLGIILAKKELGNPWMTKEFGYYYDFDNQNFGKYGSYFSINCEGDSSALVFSDIIVTIAPGCIAVVNKKYIDKECKIIINYE